MVRLENIWSFFRSGNRLITVKHSNPSWYLDDYCGVDIRNSTAGQRNSMSLADQREYSHRLFSWRLLAFSIVNQYLQKPCATLLKLLCLLEDIIHLIWLKLYVFSLKGDLHIVENFDDISPYEEV